MKFQNFILIALIIFSTTLVFSQKEENKEDKSPYKSSTFSGLKFRSLGPAVTSGRVTDFAVNPDNYHEFYVAVACGNVWKTTNSGTTWTPIFDTYGSHSIGCVTLDPNNPHVVYVGTGENNSQRSVSWGDGLYRSEDGGKSFKKI
ncbi:MAG: WD40/YVTN/BNR-like repeat-containing protein, partial [Ignavibacterium sp.]